MDRQYRVTLIKSVESECAVAVFASSPAEAERLARDLAPEEGRCWTTVNDELNTHVEGETS